MLIHRQLECDGSGDSATDIREPRLVWTRAPCVSMTEQLSCRHGVIFERVSLLSRYRTMDSEYQKHDIKAVFWTSSLESMQFLITSASSPTNLSRFIFHSLFIDTFTAFGALTISERHGWTGVLTI